MLGVQIVRGGTTGASSRRRKFITGTSENKLNVIIKTANTRQTMAQVVGWLGRASANHFQKASNQKIAGKPLENKGNLRKSYGRAKESQGSPTKKLSEGPLSNHSSNELFFKGLIKPS